MFPVEQVLPQESFLERSARTTEMGEIVEVLGWLCPSVSKETGNALEVFVQDVGRTLLSVERNDGAIVVRGSAGHRIVYNSLMNVDKPPGFDTVKRVWMGLVDTPSYGLGDCKEAHILAESTLDLDLAVDVSVNLERVADAARRRIPKSQVRVFTYADVPIVEIIVDGVTVEIHHLPDTDRLAENDHRIFMSLPICEAFSNACIRSDGSVNVNAFSQAVLRSDRVSTSFMDVLLTQAIVASQRAYSTHHIYQDAYIGELAGVYDGIGESLGYYTDNPSFWKHVRARSTPESIDPRQKEMTFGFMRLLTQDPGNLRRHRPLFDQTCLGARLSPNFAIDHNPVVYQAAFRKGTLKPDESGVVLLASQLHLPVLDVIQSLRVRDNENYTA
ncbi:MAG: hypothetical protein Q8L37_06015 [Candidatus Gottesmanbacteria bacterium]|nr:hypothetical protein [Candidatus Gottesmanbacteria bacterium]